MAAASATFCIEPIAQMQPRRKKPKYSSENTTSSTVSRRERLRRDRYAASARAAMSTAMSTYEKTSARGCGV